MAFTVFYSWQSDVPNRINRGFIESAANRVLRDFEGSTLEEAPRLDQDTRGIPGTPRITESIFDKIDECGIFLADVTLVASTIDRQKWSPNPNVLLELGYASKSLGWDRIVLVMNTHFGEPTALPFELRERRFPISYRRNPDEEADPGEKTRFCSNLGHAIDAVIQGGLKPYLRYSYRFFEHAGNPFSPTFEDLSVPAGKAFLRTLEDAKSRVEHEWIRQRSQREWDRFRRINDYVFRIFREIRFIQEKWFMVYDRYFQGMRTMPAAPSYRSDSQVQIEYAPTDQLDHWQDIGYLESFAPVQLECHQYRGPRGDGFIVFGRFKIRERSWQMSMHIGPEAERNRENFQWTELPELKGAI